MKSNKTLRSLNFALRQSAFAGLLSLYAISASPAREFGAPVPRVPEGTDSLGNAFQGPGTFPNRVTAANVDITVDPTSILGGDRSNNLKVSFPSMGPIDWTDARHNEGDFAFNLGPVEPNNPDSFPPDDFLEWAPNDGLTTYAWTVDRRAGVALATVRANGFDNDDTIDGSTPVGTRYGSTYFTHGFRSGSGYSPITGEFGAGNGSQDLVTGMIGPVDEASFDVAVAFFPWLEGWKGAHVAATYNESDFTGIFEAGSAGIGIDQSQIFWAADANAWVKIPGVDPNTDGMLFVAPADGSSNTKIAGAAPMDADNGWSVAIRQDSDGALADQSACAFSFLYLPWDTVGLIGGHVSGSDGNVMASAGDFTVARTATGEYSLAIAGKNGENGMLLLTNAGMATGGDLPTGAFLSYEFEGSTALIQVRDVTAENSPLMDSDFYFAWVDFNEPLIPAPVVPRVPEGTDSLGNAFQGPGTFPNRVTAANVDITVDPTSILGGDRSNNLKVSFPSMGPIDWTDARHNEGDFAFNLGPVEPNNPDSFPPDDFLEWAPNDGLTTYAWTVDRRAGVALATVRANGFDNDDTIDGSTPVGTRYGSTYFTHGFRSGSGYSPITGEFGAGNGSQDLVTGMIGPVDEASFDVAVAFFPWLEGWKGAHVAATYNESDFTGIFEAGSAGIGIDQSQIFWAADANAWVKIPGVDPNTDGMLFVAPADGSSNTKIAGAAPMDADNGWSVAIRQDSDGALADQSACAFSFLYLPWDTVGLIGGHVSGSDGNVMASAGDFTVARTATGEYSLAIAGKNGENGMLLLTNAGMATGGDLPTGAFLSYEFEGSTALIQVRDVTAENSPLMDSDFYFAWVDFNEPLSTPGFGNTGSELIPPVMSIDAQGTITFDGVLQSTASLNAGEVNWQDVSDAVSPFDAEPGFYRSRRSE